MKQLKDGGLAFYTNQSIAFKKALIYILPGMAGAFIVLLLTPIDGIKKSTVIWISVMVWAFIVILALGLSFLIRKFYNIPSCTLYDEYITWKDSQESRLKVTEKKLFFKDLQGFSLAIETIFLGRGVFNEKVIRFVAKDSNQVIPSYPYFSWLSEQDQKLLIRMLQDKGLTFLPENYNPN